MVTLLLISSILLWVLMLFNILLTLGLGKRINRQFPQIDFLKQGQPAPNFIAWTLEGQTVTLADYSKQRVAFIFISPHCQPCREQVPEVEAWQSQAKMQNLSFVFISDTNEAEAKEFVAELNVTYPFLIAPRMHSSFLTDYNITSTPSFYLINAGKVERAGIGAFELRQAITNFFDNGKRG